MEMDPWVVSDVLRPNLDWTGFSEAAIIHTVRVEDFIEHADQIVGKYSRMNLQFKQIHHWRELLWRCSFGIFSCMAGLFILGGKVLSNLREFCIDA